MKVDLPSKLLDDNTYDIRDDVSVGTIKMDNVIDEIRFAFSQFSLVMNILLKEENFEMMEMIINGGTLFLHGRSRVGIFNIKERHYLLPETFWEDFISVIIPFKFIKIGKCDNIEMEIKLLKDKKVQFKSEKIKFQIKLKGESCTKM